MAKKTDTCVMVAGLVSLALVVWGFWLVLQKPKGGESDGQGLQRQLKGFALLVLAGVVNSGMLMLCGSGVV